MKKISVILLALCLFLSSPSQTFGYVGIGGLLGGQISQKATEVKVNNLAWTPEGDVGSHINSSTGNLDGVVLTPKLPWKWGRVWSEIEIKPPFKVHFTYRAGEGTGADGLTFLFLADRYSSSTAHGEGLGFDGINGYAIEFDSYYNSHDPSEKHVALIKNTTKEHIVSYDTNKVDDNQEHNVEVHVDLFSVKVYLDGELIINHNEKLEEVGYHIGFTASTGASTNIHLVRQVAVSGNALHSENAELIREYKSQFEYNIPLIESKVINIKAGYDTLDENQKEVVDELAQLINSIKDSALKKRKTNTDNPNIQTIYDLQWLYSWGDGIKNVTKEMKDSADIKASAGKFFDLPTNTAEAFSQKLVAIEFKPIFYGIYQDEEIAEKLANDYAAIWTMDPYQSVLAYGAFQQSLMDASFGQIEKVMNQTASYGNAMAVSKSDSAGRMLVNLDKYASNHVTYLARAEFKNVERNIENTEKTVKKYQKEVEEFNEEMAEKNHTEQQSKKIDVDKSVDSNHKPSKNPADEPSDQQDNIIDRYKNYLENIEEFNDKVWDYKG
ncbi:L-type lectin-domain containing protein [Lederbergia graminis]|uniref:L-type lectin-domain containing protein n=1 Tax=Lederbergia graminis TaxID=735518 RepID=A0ABW0LLA1_9BACI